MPRPPGLHTAPATAEPQQPGQPRATRCVVLKRTSRRPRALPSGLTAPPLHAGPGGGNRSPVAAAAHPPQRQAARARAAARSSPVPPARGARRERRRRRRRERHGDGRRKRLRLLRGFFTLRRFLTLRCLRRAGRAAPPSYCPPASWQGREAPPAKRNTVSGRQGRRPRPGLGSRALWASLGTAASGEISKCDKGGLF